MKANYREYMEQYIEGNEIRIGNMREDIVRDLERIIRDINAELEAQKDGKGLHSIDTLVSNTQSSLLNVLKTANRVQILQAESAAYKMALKAADELKGE